MTTQRPNAAAAVGRPARCAHAGPRRRHAPAGAPLRGARAQGRRPVPRRARHEDPGALPRRRWSAATTRSSRRGLHQGLPAQLRALPRPRPRRGPRAVAARARRAQGRAGDHLRAAAARGAAPGPDLLAVIVVLALMTIGVLAFGGYLGVQLLRFAKPPTISVTDPATAVIDVDDAATSYTLRGVTAARARPSASTTGPRTATRTGSPPRSTGLWSATVDLRRGRNQFDVNAIDPETGKHSEDTIRLYITVPFPTVEAPTLSVDQPAEGATLRERGDPRPGHDHERDRPWSITSAYTRTGHAAGGRQAHARAAEGPGPEAGADRRRRDVLRAARADRRPLGHHDHRVQRRGQEDRADPERDRRLPGRQRRRVGPGEPCVAQGLGRRQGLRPDRGGRARLRPGQGPDVQRRGSRSRSGPASPAPRTSR